MAIVDPTVPAPAATCFNLLWPSLDAGSQFASAWFEYQRGLWQPWFDLQSEWLGKLAGQDAWPLYPAWMMRGTEQLA